MFKRLLQTATLSRRALLTGLFTTLSLSAVLAFGGTDQDGAHSRDNGLVMAITNAPAGNAVVLYRRAADGSLAPDGVYPSGGVGTGGGLGSQGAVVVTDDRRFVLAVNAGSNSVSSFRIRHDGLELVDTGASGGLMPTSIAVRNGLVLVLNAGVPNNITAFHLSPHGRLEPVEGSTRPLSAASTSPAQVAFSDDGTGG